jgi:hypothetical protein
VIADAADTTIVRDDAAAVAVDQAADEFLGGLVDERLLPRFEGDAAVVLAAWAVLGEQTWPVLGVEANLKGLARHPPDGCMLAGHDRIDGFAAPTDDRRILGVENYT